HNAGTKLKDNQAFRGLLDYLQVADALPLDLTHEKARAYVRWLKTEAKSARGGPLADATIHGRIAPLRIFWNDFLEHNELVPLGTNPWRGHKVTTKRKKANSAGEQATTKRPYTQEEILKLLKGPEMRDAENVRYPKRTLMELYALGFYTGAR